MLPADVGGANWPGGSFDRRPTDSTSTRTLRSLRCRTFPPGSSPSIRARQRAPAPLRPPAAARRRRRLVDLGLAPVDWERNWGRRSAASTFLQGTIPLIKPPYDRITAYDMNTGEILWQSHPTTPDNIRNNAALAGIDVSRLGAYGRIFIGTLTTKNLVIAGEGDVHTDANGETVALLRAYDKKTGEDVEGEVRMPAKQTGSPMTYMHDGKQYIVVAVSQSGVNAGAELIAYSIP